ncbi:MAG: ribonuclease HII [candidate division WOR-3 bacterium]
MESVYRFLDYINIKAKKPIGVDEAGRGPLAGPIVACALYVPEGENISFVRDSKILTYEKRREFLDRLLEKNIRFGVGFVFPEEIDRIGIQEANYLAMKRAIRNLRIRTDLILVDGFKIKSLKKRQIVVIKGDKRIDVIAGASIIAKVTRDMWMEAMHEVYPDYRFDINKGYYSDFHVEMIKKKGVSPLHRKTFEPIKTILKEKGVL